jgi:hypothetical protein
VDPVNENTVLLALIAAQATVQITRAGLAYRTTRRRDEAKAAKETGK